MTDANSQFANSEQALQNLVDDAQRFGLYPCFKCGGEMHPGIALAPTIRVGCADFPGTSPVDEKGRPARGQTFDFGGPGKVVDCLKCQLCGWSYTKG
jgi:hypothetical protein